MGVEGDRLRLIWASAAEGQQLAEAIDKFVEDVRKLGPLAGPPTGRKRRAPQALESIVQEHAEAMEVLP